MVIQQGDIFWLDLGTPAGSGIGHRHLYVVVQSDDLNDTPLHTTIVCELTPNLWRAKAPGNILLAPDEGNLPDQSVVNVSRVYTIDKHRLGEPVGTLAQSRMREITRNLCQVLQPSVLSEFGEA